MFESHKSHNIRNPYCKFGVFRKFLFVWIMPFFWQWHSPRFMTGDMASISRNFHANNLGDEMQEQWNYEIKISKLKGRKPKLWKVLAKTSQRIFTIATLFYLLNQCVIVALQPLVLRRLLHAFKQSDDSNVYLYSGILSGMVFIQTLTLQPAVFNLMVLALKLRVGLSSLIYRKSLKLGPSSHTKTSTGQIINLVTNDLNRFDTHINSLPYLITSPIQLCVLMYMLYNEVGTPSLTGLGLVLLLIPIQVTFGKISAVFRLSIAKMTDWRGAKLNEVFEAIHFIKQYVWEKPFMALCEHIRSVEIKEVRKIGILRGIQTAMIIFTPKLAQYVVFLILALTTEEAFSSEIVFFTMSSLNIIIQMNVYYAPQATAGLGEIIVVINRVENFLLMEEHKMLPSIATNKNNRTAGISMHNVCAKWNTDDGHPVLNNVSFDAFGDTIVMVIGPTGSSKSSLLQAIINELPISSGSIHLDGSISYASQSPWLFAGTVRENIVFGESFDEERYLATLKACSLLEDLDQLPRSDLTLVGERGSNLSGGQRTRVALARAVYRKADVYILDDPLSSLDSKVANDIVGKCIKTHLKNSVRIFVTHRLPYISFADHIILMNAGKIAFQGNADQFRASGFDLFTETIEFKDSAHQSSEIGATTTTNFRMKSGSIVDHIVNLEGNASGSVTVKTYLEYFMSGNSRLSFNLLVLSFVACQFFASVNDFWLSTINGAANTGGLSTLVSSLNENEYLEVYTAIVICLVVISLSRSLWFFKYCANISIDIHKRMFENLMENDIQFYDKNPCGRIMNRFTRDVGTIDELLPIAFIGTFTVFLQAVGVIVNVLVSNYYMSVPVVFLVAFLYSVRKCFVETTRDLRRKEAISRSFLLDHLVESLQGLATIRSFRAETLFINEFDSRQNMHSSIWYLYVAATRAFGLWLEILCNIFLVITIYSFIFFPLSEDPGYAGLAITSLLSLTGSFQWGMRQSVELENHMVSVERLLEYTKIGSKEAARHEGNNSPPPTWPSEGQIEFQSVSLTYGKDKKTALNDISFAIKFQEKVGVVGRTGAGKSSLTSVLLKMIECSSGDIIIDGVNIKNVNGQNLREKISIIPQSPVLFSATIRFNLDPFNKFDDCEIWRVIEEVELKNCITSLDQEVARGGSNFSIGQKQLLCLARAILRKNKIVIIDEATANIDFKTESLIEKVMGSKFKDCTVITIAHRLNSVFGCDKILVLENGSLMEAGHPHELLRNESGKFKSYF